MTTQNFKTLHIWDTKFNADSVEWCPIVPHRNTFACGLYHLTDDIVDEGPKKRYERGGGIMIFTLSKGGLKVDSKMQCAAVLDLKWCSKKLNGNITLVSATADAEINLLYLEELKLRKVSKCKINQVEDMNHLICAVDWVKNDTSDLLCASDTKGNICLIKVQYNSLVLLKVWSGHSLEAWTVCFDSFNQNIIYSGGDESELKVWDYRDDIVKKYSVSKHSAGVTALNSSLFKEYNLVSGSYDESIIFWDVRTMRKPVEQVRACGGVWRLKWEPYPDSVYLLAACIYGGFQIFDTSNYTVVGEYKEHESLAYGGDWAHLTKDEVKNLLDCEESSLLATCSFYDNRVCVSIWNNNMVIEKY